MGDVTEIYVETKNLFVQNFIKLSIEEFKNEKESKDFFKFIVLIKLII